MNGGGGTKRLTLYTISGVYRERKHGRVEEKESGPRIHLLHIVGVSRAMVGAKQEVSGPGRFFSTLPNALSYFDEPDL